MRSFPDSSRSVLIAALSLHTASFTDEQHLWFLEFYKKLCCLGLQHENGHCESQPYPLELENKYALVRRNCAYNFPVSDTKLRHEAPTSHTLC